VFIIGKNDGYPMKIGKCFLPKMNFKKSPLKKKIILNPNRLTKLKNQPDKIVKSKKYGKFVKLLPDFE